MILLFLALWLPTFAKDPVQKLEIIRSIPHSGYSEGLDFFDGFLWHALPKEILKIDPKTGTVVERFPPPTDYSESIVWFRNQLFNLSFSDNSIHSAKLGKRGLSFKRVGAVPEVHGWGITHDGQSLIVTGHYSQKLYFLNPATLRVTRFITTTVSALEDLAWDGSSIWTSSFTGYRGQIFRVSPKDGTIDQFFSLPDPEACPVIDGIAHDGKYLWVTGKHCPSIFMIRPPKK